MRKGLREPSPQAVRAFLARQGITGEDAAAMAYLAHGANIRSYITGTSNMPIARWFALVAHTVLPPAQIAKIEAAMEAAIDAAEAPACAQQGLLTMADLAVCVGASIRATSQALIDLGLQAPIKRGTQRLYQATKAGYPLSSPGKRGTLLWRHEVVPRVMSKIKGSD